VAEIFTKGRYYQKGEKEHEKWLTNHLETQENVLAWLGVYSVASPLNEYEEKQKKKLLWRYLLTSDRHALVAFGDNSEATVYELPAQALQIISSFGRDTVILGDFKWKTEFRNDYLYNEIKEIPGLEDIYRIRETARLNWLEREKNKKNAEYSLWLLSHLTGEESDPFDDLTHSYIEYIIKVKKQREGGQAIESLRESCSSCIKKILQKEEAGVRLKEWARLWDVSGSCQMVFVQLIRELISPEKGAALSLGLHRQARELILKKQKDTSLRLEINLEFARHLLALHGHEEAQLILEKCLKRLPDKIVSDLTPSHDVNLTERNCHSPECQVLELLAQARGKTEGPDADTLAALAQLQPLVSSRVADVINGASGSLRRRAQKLLHILEGAGGLKAHEREEHVTHRPANPLSKKLIETKITHPAVSKGDTFDIFQKWLGKAKVPDYSVLKSYAERVTPQKYPHIIESLGDAAMALGVSSVDAYISRGERSIGVRAFEGTPPFILIGVEHLEPESDFYMRPSEMRFVLGTEAAHLRFHHTRFTSDELWDGVFHKGKQILEAVSLLAGPIGLVGNALRGIEKISRAERIISRAEVLSAHAVRAIDFFGIARGAKDSAQEKSHKSDDTISDSGERLLAACRMMQLTADRAGLVLCGDLRSAIRAIFLSSRTQHGELALAERYGLVKALNRKNDKGELINQELAIRFASLCSFYLSDDFIELRNKVLTGVEMLSELLDLE
jgi:hypothetical protein